MKFRKSTWLDTRTKRPVFGIEVKPSPRDHWFNLHENGNPLLFDNESERDAKLLEYKAATPPPVPPEGEKKL